MRPDRSLSYEEIRIELVTIRKQYEYLLTKLSGRRLRESEKALTRVAYERRIKAINAALAIVKSTV